MMGGSVNIGKLFGIQLKLHFSWFIIFTLLTFALVAPNWNSGFAWAIGVLTSLLFFASVLAHELAHSLVGRANGIPVSSITLFIFGGISTMTREASRPNAELKMAAAGPICSAVIGSICLANWFLNPGIPPLVARMTLWLAIMNFALAIFNLIPGFPLDGGRIFRSVLWRSTGDFTRATRIATRVGQGVGYAFIGGGIAIAVLYPLGLSPFGLNWFSGLWIAFIGWFLQNAAKSSYQQTEWREILRKFTAAQVMTTDTPLVPPETTIHQLVTEYVFPRGQRLFLVASGGDFKGTLTIDDIKAVSRPQWDTIQVSEVMTPLDKLASVSPTQDALSVLEQMTERNLNQIPVVSDGRVIGLISRDDLIRFLRTHAELGTRK
jgi:Zn-dependent protease/CBS domain-containing protein